VQDLLKTLFGTMREHQDGRSNVSYCSLKNHSLCMNCIVQKQVVESRTVITGIIIDTDVDVMQHQ
jgi:hypothetical protein